MRGCDNPNIDFFGTRLSHSRDHAFLQRSQYLDLKWKRHLANFVQEERAAIGCLKFSRPRDCRPCKRTTSMPEQLTFQQALAAGVVPFLIGDVVKAVLAAAALPLAWKLLK